MRSIYQPHIIRQGGTVRLKCPQPGHRKGGGLRKPISEFTSRSRRNLMQKFASTDWEALMRANVPVLFLTLTLSPEYWDDTRTAKKGVAAVQRWLSDLDGFQGGMVRREYGSKRGAMHYHLITLGLARLDVQQLRRLWSQAVEYRPALGKPEFLRVDVERTETADHVARYLCKYVSKAAWEGAARRGVCPGTELAEGAGTQAPAEVSCTPESGGECLALSKAQNSTEGAQSPGNIEEMERGDTHTGTRYWSFWGSWPFCEMEFLDFSALPGAADAGKLARKIGTRARRLFRRWRVELERSKVVRELRSQSYPAGNGWHSPYANLGPCARKQADIQISKLADKHCKAFQRGKLRFLRAGGGFTLFLSPTLIDAMLYSSASRDVFMPGVGVANLPG
jgi:hypothetical protein